MKTVISSLEEVAEPLRTEYESKDGKFYLKIEGDVPAVTAANAKVVEFRDNNIRLLKEVEDLRPLKTQFEGIDPVAAKDAIAKVKALGAKGIQDVTDFETRVRVTVDDLIKPIKEQLTAAEARTAAERARADEFLLHSTITDKFVKAGGRAKASDQVVTLAKDNFEIRDGKVAAKTGKFSTEKPAEALTPEEWLTGTVLKEHDYLFEPSNGGGANQKPAGGQQRTPIANREGVRVVKNPTPQELGALGADVKAGKVRIEYDPVTQ